MPNIEIFNFEEQPVRFVGTAEKPLWVGKDICDILSLSKYRDALARLDSDERELVLLDTPGGKQSVTCINESGMYSLIFDSRKPQAKRLKKWVTSEVLPSIRKTGSYAIAQSSASQSAKNESTLSIQDQILIANFGAESAINAGVSKPIAESIKLDSLGNVLPEAKPLLLPQKNAIASANPIEEQPVSPTIIGQRVAAKMGLDKVSAIAVNKKLLSLGYQLSVTRLTCSPT
ncbi:prophage antirepressor [Xenococcus sp. PCC 7305]|uniref:BRO-N domain-containing protein n=1 Tax=Xenococcus sp. PCC 7305 TaxID=102125 RepID=UPI0002ABCE4C|nr:BRO family protein [Xenococcus sp. PCC 7305]ELS01148.1 prophage antirepressor [Xenococcus sp. PCC 7305]